jgi:hypothetical protein
MTKQEIEVLVEKAYPLYNLYKKDPELNRQVNISRVAEREAYRKGIAKGIKISKLKQ